MQNQVTGEYCVDITVVDENYLVIYESVIYIKAIFFQGSTADPPWPAYSDPQTP